MAAAPPHFFFMAWGGLGDGVSKEWGGSRGAGPPTLLPPDPFSSSSRNDGDDQGGPGGRGGRARKGGKRAAPSDNPFPPLPPSLLPFPWPPPKGGGRPFQFNCLFI
jgi:hypothetical protein